MTTRRFAPPWSVEDIDAAFVVKDHSGQGQFPHRERSLQFRRISVTASAGARFAEGVSDYG
jgi:hypothetical protein